MVSLMSSSASGSGARKPADSRPQSIGERVLLKFCRPVDSPPYPGGTDRATIDNALDFLKKTVPDFLGLIRGKSILDFGCGYGQQAAALVLAGAANVTGLDLPRPDLQARWSQIEGLGLKNLRLTTSRPDGLFDVVLSCSSFEHFSDPAAILQQMREYARPGGLVIVSFAEPWLSPRGSHADGFTRLPWVNVFFSEKTVLRVRSRYKNDGAQRYEDVEGGLNRMTVRRFENLMRTSGMTIREIHAFP